MQKQLLFLLAIIFSINTYSQISFENGYYIDNSNNKINCLIKNVDWKNNPTEFEYKLSENGEPVKITITSVKEFGIDKTSKYIRDNVNIDRSGKNINFLSTDKNPVYKEETLFLKVLVEGKANLYEYVDGNLTRYFYSKENSSIEQLIFKKYKTPDEGDIRNNNRFRQQLWSELKCPNIELRRIENLDYKKNDLVGFFADYSDCHNSNLINFEQKEKNKREMFNLTIRPRINRSSLSLQSSYSSIRETDFENKVGLGIGLEAEFLLPFNKNKWAIIIEPTYRYYNSEKVTNANLSQGDIIGRVDYSSIEVPVGLRHYFFLNMNSKLFVNTSFIFDIHPKSSITFDRSYGPNLEGDLEIASGYNYAFGTGYKYNNKYSIELRYQTGRELLSDYTSWNSEYTQLSVVFGYSVF